MKTFKKILLATDFSDNAATAYHYAYQLAARLKSELHVLNVYEIPINPNNSQYLDMMPSIDDLEQVSKNRLSRLVNENSNQGNTMVASRVKVTTEALIGFPADRLIEMSKDPSVDLIVVGSAGEHGWVDRIFGSVAVQVASEAFCPVLLVPQDADYKGIHHLLYASSFDSAAIKSIHLTLDWTKYFMGDIHFLHVNTPSEKHPRTETLTFEKLLEREKTKVPFTVENIEAETVPDGIRAYTVENPIDMIITVTRHRSFWENMTHNSVTKALAWNTHIPIMVLHSDDISQSPV
jgi:nucleotide-binding universal stress UspA family protein